MPPAASLLTSCPTPRDREEARLGHLADVLAHRIRNLLAGIEGCTDLLAETLGDRDQRELALRILENTARIEGVLADLQRFSAPVALMPVPVTPRQIVERLLQTLDDAALDGLTLDLPDARPTLLADPALLHQALHLLVQNAREAAPAVVVRVRVEAAPPRVAFDVWNTGALGAEAAAHVFEPFYTTKTDNLGIGLWMARRIAEAHGGTLSLTATTPDTCFSLRLPTVAFGREGGKGKGEEGA